MKQINKKNFYYKSLFSILFVNIMLTFYTSLFYYNEVWMYYDYYPSKFIIIKDFIYLIIFLWFYYEVVWKIINIRFIDKTKVKKKKKGKNKSSYWILVLILISLIFNSNGPKAGEIYLNKFSLFFNLFDLSIIILLFYFNKRKKNPKQVILILIIYICYRLMLGWTGIILTIFIWELLNKYKLKKKKYLKIIFIYLNSLIFGGMIYSFMYPLKFYIRYGYISSRLNLKDGLFKLINRLFPLSAYIFTKNNLFELNNQVNHSQVNFIMEFFTSWIPRIFWSSKPIFFNLCNEIEKLRLGYKTVSNNDTTILGTLYFYFSRSFLEGLAVILLLLLFLIILKYFASKYLNCELQKILITTISIKIFLAGKLIGLNFILSFIMIIFLFNIFEKDMLLEKN